MAHDDEVASAIEGPGVPPVRVRGVDVAKREPRNGEAQFAAGEIERRLRIHRSARFEQRRTRNLLWQLSRRRVIQVAIGTFFVTGLVVFSDMFFELLEGWLGRDWLFPHGLEVIFWLGVVLAVVAPLLAMAAGAYFVDLKDPYLTMTDDYIESVWWILKNFWDKNLLFKGFKIVPYCPRCGTRHGLKDDHCGTPNMAEKRRRP